MTCNCTGKCRTPPYTCHGGGPYNTYPNYFYPNEPYPDHHYPNPNYYPGFYPYQQPTYPMGTGWFCPNCNVYHSPILYSCPNGDSRPSTNPFYAKISYTNGTETITEIVDKDKKE